MLDREQTIWIFFFFFLFLTQLSPENVSLKFPLKVLARGKEPEGKEKF